MNGSWQGGRGTRADFEREAGGGGRREEESGRDESAAVKRRRMLDAVEKRAKGE